MPETVWMDRVTSVNTVAISSVCQPRRAGGLMALYIHLMHFTILFLHFIFLYLNQCCRSRKGYVKHPSEFSARSQPWGEPILAKCGPHPELVTNISQDVNGNWSQVNQMCDLIHNQWAAIFIISSVCLGWPFQSVSLLWMDGHPSMHLLVLFWAIDELDYVGGKKKIQTQARYTFKTAW